MDVRAIFDTYSYWSFVCHLPEIETELNVLPFYFLHLAALFRGCRGSGPEDNQKEDKMGGEYKAIRPVSMQQESTWVV